MENEIGENKVDKVDKELMAFKNASLAGEKGHESSYATSAHSVGVSNAPSGIREQGGYSGKDAEFNTIRYRLDQLDYKEWLDPISMPLVKRLLSDLINTTQVAREWKGLG